MAFGMGRWSVGELGTHWLQLAVFTILELVRISELMLWELLELFIVNHLCGVIVQSNGFIMIAS